MNIETLLRYLIGDRKAILTIAESRHTLGIGLLFVLSAALAREYDGADLLHEPWHLLLPLAASVAASFVLFTLAYSGAVLNDEPLRAFFSRYRTFLGLFWMTAPLAWLYAVPYERFLSPADAVRMNLLTLGVVSVWRVALMVRVLLVILGYPWPAALTLVGLFGDGLALLLIVHLPAPVINMMGGISIAPSEADRILQDTTLAVVSLGFLTFPLWLMAACVVLASSRPVWQVRETAPTSLGRLTWLAVASVLVWAFVLPWTQPEQIHKRTVERAFAERRFADALHEMQMHPRSAFPPAWDPPPYLFFSDLELVLQELARTSPAGPHDWCREAYLEKTSLSLAKIEWGSSAHLRRLAAALRRIPDGPTVADRLDERGQSRHAKLLREALQADQGTTEK